MSRPAEQGPGKDGEPEASKTRPIPRAAESPVSAQPVTLSPDRSVPGRSPAPVLSHPGLATGRTTGGTVAGRAPGTRIVVDRALQDLWVRRLKARDAEALREVVAAFSERLGAVVAGILRDRDAVEDVVQETFTKAWLRIDSFAGGSSLYTWLYRVAVNGCKDHLKRRRRRPESSLEGLGPDAVGADASAPPIEDLERRELRRRVQAAIARLPEKFRSVLALREIEGMTYPEISQVLSLNLGTVESRLFRARRRLREILEAAAPGAGPRGTEGDAS